jgi:hypothetical protein
MRHDFKSLIEDMKRLKNFPDDFLIIDGIFINLYNIDKDKPRGINYLLIPNNEEPLYQHSIVLTHSFYKFVAASYKAIEDERKVKKIKPKDLEIQYDFLVEEKGILFEIVADGVNLFFTTKIPFAKDHYSYDVYLKALKRYTRVLSANEKMYIFDNLDIVPKDTGKDEITKIDIPLDDTTLNFIYNSNTFAKRKELPSDTILIVQETKADDLFHLMFKIKGEEFVEMHMLYLLDAKI